MPRTVLQHTPVRRVSWATTADSEEVILDVPLRTLANTLIKNPLACLASAAKCFPRQEFPPRYPHDAVAMRSLLEPTLLFCVVANVLSKHSVVPIVEEGDNASAFSKFERQLASGGVFQRTAMHLNEFGINSTIAVPISQLNGPKGFLNIDSATVVDRVQSLSLRYLRFDAPNCPRLEPQRYPMGAVFGSGSFVGTQNRHSYSAARLRLGHGSTTKLGLSSISVRRSLPHATRLPGHDYRARACDFLDTLNSMLDGRRLTSSQGSRLFMSMSVRVPAKKLAVDRSCFIKETSRFRDLRALATGQSNVAITTSEPSAFILRSTAYSNSLEQIFHCRRPRTTPQSHFVEGAAYVSSVSFDFMRSSKNQAYHASVALIDRTVLVTPDQIALQVFANGMLESGPVEDMVLLGFSGRGHVLQSASPLLATACECPRAGFFLDSRMQEPSRMKGLSTDVQDMRVDLRKVQKLLGDSTIGRPVVRDVWRNQYAARFRVVAPHTELAALVAQMRVFHSDSIVITQRLALLSHDPNVLIVADAKHASFLMDCALDISLNIRPHMTGRARMSTPLAVDP